MGRKHEITSWTEIRISKFKFCSSKFNFRPESDDVGKKLVVEKVIIGMGQSNSGIKMNLHQIIPEEKFGRPPYEKDFPSFRARK